MAAVRTVWSPSELAREQAAHAGCLELTRDSVPARCACSAGEVVVGLSPAFARDLWQLALRPERRRGAAPGARGHRGGGLRTHGSCACGRTIDVGAIGWTAARLVGLGNRHRAAGEGHRPDPPAPTCRRWATSSCSRSRRASRASCTAASGATLRAMPAAPSRSHCSWPSRTSRSGPATTRASSRWSQSSGARCRCAIPSRSSASRDLRPLPALGATMPMSPRPEVAPSPM